MLDTGVTIGPRSPSRPRHPAHLRGRLAAQLAHRLDLQLEPVHVAFGEIAAEVLSGSLPLGATRFVRRQEVVGLPGG